MDATQKQELWQQFKALEAKAISMNHYDLARVTSIKDVQLWKQFLTDPEVSAYIDQETQILTQTELRKLASDVSESRSVGQAQLINAMQKLTDNKTTKEGPVFIYTYVPLSESQMKAPNVQQADHDLFEENTAQPEPTIEEHKVAPVQLINHVEFEEDEF